MALKKPVSTIKALAGHLRKVNNRILDAVADSRPVDPAFRAEKTRLKNEIDRKERGR